MGSDIEQHDFLFGELKRVGQTVAVGDADRLHAGELAAQTVKLGGCNELLTIIDKLWYTLANLG